MAAQRAMGPSNSQPIRDDLAKGAGCRTFLPGACGLGIAIVLFGLGTMMRGEANFAHDYVGRQLAEQRITFKAVDALAPEERHVPCLVENAGKPLTTGGQAECYANGFIARHLKAVAGGQTYSELRDVQTSLRAQIATAQGSGDPAAADLQRHLNEVTAKRQTLFEGETVRGLLLSSFGFSTLGDRAAFGATVAFVAGAVVLLLSAIFLARAMSRPKPARRNVTPPGTAERSPLREMASAGGGSRQR